MKKATGLIKGTKIDIKNSPKNYNIMAEFDLKNHFLKKLDELRVMRDEYYQAPEEPIDPIEVIKAKHEAEEAIKKKKRGMSAIESPWDGDGDAIEKDIEGSRFKTLHSDDDNQLETPGEPGLTTSVLLQYYSKNELT